MLALCQYPSNYSVLGPSLSLSANHERVILSNIDEAFSERRSGAKHFYHHYRLPTLYKHEVQL